GDALPTLDIPIGISDIVAMSIATRDFHPVHHDAQTAQRLGHPALFLNIMTTAGLVERFMRSWCGAQGWLASLKLKLGVPHYAGTTLVMSGQVTALGEDDAGRWVDVAFTGSNSSGRHASGEMRIRWS
ncbi:MAG TPA: acyl dehydratase, partial [Burkholderiaceae bacterium]|nr:acyl dehydratase [Burkholderiaceae bacterium]